MPGERAVSRSPFEGDGRDPVDHAGHRRRGEPEVAMPPRADHREHARRRQLREMGAGGLRRDPGRAGELARGQGPAVEQGRHHRRPRRVADQRRDLGDHGTGDHARRIRPSVSPPRGAVKRRSRNNGRGLRAVSALTGPAPGHRVGRSMSVGKRPRGRLFWKYVVLFVALVSGALVASGLVGSTAFSTRAQGRAGCDPAREGSPRRPGSSSSCARSSGRSRLGGAVAAGVAGDGGRAAPDGLHPADARPWPSPR